MADGAQIQTSVTIISSLLGFQAISLTDVTTSSASSIAAGSKVEIAGAFFHFATDCAPNASSWTAITTGTTAYLSLTPSGSAGTQIVSASYIVGPPVWSTSKQGWYASAGSVDRVIGSAYKVGPTSYQNKTIYATPSQGDKYDLGRFHMLPPTQTNPGGYIGSELLGVGSLWAIPTAYTVMTSLSCINIMGIPSTAKAISARIVSSIDPATTGASALQCAFSDTNTAASSGTNINYFSNPVIYYYTYFDGSLTGKVFQATDNNVIIPLDSTGRFYVHVLANTPSQAITTLSITALGYYTGD